MKKLLWLTLATLVAAISFQSCKDKPEPEPEPSNIVATVSASDLLDAAAAAYDAWEENTTIPTSLSVGGKTLTQPQYQYAICKLLVNLSSGDKSDIGVIGYKEAEHPERDSYDQKEIAVTGGSKITEGTEDLVDIAKRMIAAMADKLTVPNQTVITRSGESAIAFSTNRATVTILRALAEYKSKNALPAKVSTDYLSAAATLKGFAQQFVGILDIWDKTVGTVSADGSHCTDNNSAWQNVHFVPIPHSGGAYADGKDQYDAKYQPYFTVTIDGKEYTSAQTWGIALRGIMDLITTEGSAKKQVNRNPFEHTMGNGASLKEPIPAVTENDIWGQYPWYESTNDGPAINLDQFSPYLIARCASWFLTRQEALGKIGNYQFFTTDPEEGFVEDGVSGFVSSMRMWLIAARFYKYLLDNNITENVYDAVKDVTFATDLYGVEMPDIELQTKSVEVKFDGTAVNATFTAKKEWTATASEPWIHVDPASGNGGGSTTIAISADANTGAARSGIVTIKGGNVTEGLEITVNQGAYTAISGTLKDFAQEFVKGLDVWEATVGTVESEGKHLIERGTAWQNVHFIPVGKTGGPYDDHAGNQHDAQYEVWKLNVNGTEVTSSQAWEIAIRGLMNMVTTEGEAFLDEMTDRNKPYTLGNGVNFATATIPNPSSANKWGSYPWYEASDEYQGLTYNGQPVTEVDVNFMVKVGAWHVVRSFIAVGANSPLNAIGNFQQFGTASSTLNLEGYDGLIAPMRELLVLMRIYKYLLTNNVKDKVYDAIKDQKFDFDLYNQGAAPVDNVPTIAEFATEFAKVASTWEANVGNVTYTYDGTTYNKENVHFVPDNFTITVKGNTYDKYQMHEVALNAFKAIENGGAITDKVTAPLSYSAASARWHEYGDPLQETVAKVDLLSNFATRCLNYIKNNGEWPNVCGYPRNSDPVLTTYHGYVSLERDLLMMSRLFKYVVDNNITSDILNAIKDVEISTALYDKPVSTATIADFAKEYVKILDIWQKTTGEVVMHPDVPEETVANAHYVPSTTTITVGGKTYNTADMWETALRSYLLIRGYNGLETEKYGKNSIPALEDGAQAMSTTLVPDTHGYYWGSAPFNETKGNGGHLVMGTADENEHCKVKVDILDNWAMRSLNYQHGQAITNLCGYASGQLAGYYGCFSSQRALLTYAFFFKYMLDNNLDKGTDVGDDVIIRSELLGDEGGQPTLKDFAKEFVKGLDVWQATVGTVESEGKHLIEKGTAWENVHFIPVGKTLGAYDDHEGNQHDAKWTVWKMNVGGQEITSSQAWEIAIRGLMNMVTAEGEAFLPTMDTRNKAYTLANNAKFSTAPIPSATEGNIWGNYPWYEADDNYTGLTYNGGPVTEVDVNFMVKVGAWHVVRSFVKTSGNSPLGKIGNYQQFGTSSSTLNLEGYEGLIAPMRELLILMRIYKDLLDNDIDANVYDAIKDKKYSFDLYGIK